MKIIYIAHPVSGDIKGNLNKIKNIVKNLNHDREDIVPFAPYYLDCIALDDNDPNDRARGIKNNKAYFYSGVIDEVWVYGISDGVREEIKLAESLNIPVYGVLQAQVNKDIKTEEAIKAFKNMVKAIDKPVSLRQSK